MSTRNGNTTKRSSKNSTPEAEFKLGPPGTHYCNTCQQWKTKVTRHECSDCKKQLAQYKRAISSEATPELRRWKSRLNYMQNRMTDLESPDAIIQMIWTVANEMFPDKKYCVRMLVATWIEHLKHASPIQRFRALNAMVTILSAAELEKVLDFETPYDIIKGWDKVLVIHTIRALLEEGYIHLDDIDPPPSAGP